jgi:glyoxylase-like metal-dependent hydrolase (beta-lactamase superfamily II)
VHVETLAVGPLGCNCSILADVEAGRAIVVDPGGDLEKIRGRLDALGVKVEAILHTHTHFDHVGCTADLQRASGAPASIHQGDRFLYDILPLQAGMFGFEVPAAADMDDGLVDGRTLHAGSLEVAVLHTPGHTPGSCSFVASQGGETVVVAGDTLFRGNIGRTDLWGGDHVAILKSIRSKLLSLPDDARVVTGHGASTTIGHERAHNRFLRGA